MNQVRVRRVAGVGLGKRDREGGGGGGLYIYMECGTGIWEEGEVFGDPFDMRRWG